MAFELSLAEWDWIPESHWAALLISNSTRHNCIGDEILSLIEFWGGASLDVDLQMVGSSAVPVKGKSYSNPCRLLEIYGNSNVHNKSNRGSAILERYKDDIQFTFLPKIPGVTVRFGADIYHPPFLWCDCSPAVIATNFTYSTNAIYRILSNLAEEELLPERAIDHILDDACLLLAAAYKCDRHFTIKNINNNINMFMIAKIIETLLEKAFMIQNIKSLIVQEWLSMCHSRWSRNTPVFR